MNKLIKNYIYAVIRRVDNSEKEEIAKELEANIYDMLDNDHSDENIKRVLKEIGSPIYVATRYVKKEKHIVHPMFYYDYLTVLKIVLTISVVVSLVVSVIKIFTSSVILTDLGETIDLVVDGIVGSALGALASGVTFVTILFFILSNNLENEKVRSFLSNFNPDQVLDAPDDLFKNAESKLSIYLETILSSFFTILFSSLFIAFYEKLGVYENGVFITSAINPDYRLMLSLMVGIGVAIFVVSQVYYLIRLKKDLFYDIFDILHAILSIICATILLTLKDIVNPSFVSYMANLFKYDLTQMQNIFNYGLMGVFLIIIVVSIIEIIVISTKRLSKKLTD